MENPTNIAQAMELALRLHRAGQLADAQSLYRQILSIQPHCADAMHLLGVLLCQQKQSDEGISLIRRSIQLAPDVADYHRNLGRALFETRQTSDAVVSLRRSLEIDPSSQPAWSHLGLALQSVRQFSASLQAFERAVALRPNDPDAGNNLGNALQMVGRLDEAITAYQRALALKPDFPEARTALGAALLSIGDFENGWPEYEWRWYTGTLAAKRPNFTAPLWDGSRVDGKRILLHSEQGFGDAMQFVRFVPQVRERGGKIILAAPSQLRRLLRGIESIDQFILVGDPLPDHDLHCPFMSLPLALKTRPDTIPAAPYLRAEPALVDRWRQRVESAAKGRLKVGITWAGGPQHMDDLRRSLPLDALEAIVRTENVCFFSLRKDPIGNDNREFLRALPMIDWTAELEDFSDTAGLIENLDLVIVVDTAVSHLSGALGKPTWLILAKAPDWRWMMDREDSPWYPSMRLFRQPVLDDWDTPVRRVIDGLQQLSRTQGA